MNNQKLTLLRDLKKKRVIDSFDTGKGVYHRLASNLSFTIPDTKISELKKAYEPGLEKGGFLLFSYQKKKQGVVLELQEIIFIPNDSPCPEYAYRPLSTAYSMALASAAEKMLIPCFFHSHPTIAQNIVGESFNFNWQMNTSEPDRIASLFPTFLENFNLRLPEFLIVCNGSIKSGIFLGIYGGLVSPLDFSERKHELNENFVDNALKDLNGFFDTPIKKVLGVAGIGLAIYGVFKYPKISMPLIFGTAAVMPSIIYQTSDHNEVFGMSYGSSITIHLPKMEDEVIRRDENILHELRERRNKSSNEFKAA